MNEISFPECGICDGMRVCQCQKVDNRRFIAACHAMQGLLAYNSERLTGVIISDAVEFADALIKELERK